MDLPVVIRAAVQAGYVRQVARAQRVDVPCNGGDGTGEAVRLGVVGGYLPDRPVLIAAQRELIGVTAGVSGVGPTEVGLHSHAGALR